MLKLTIAVVAWPLLLAVLAGLVRARGNTSCGLPMSYAIGLTLIHFFGACVHIFDVPTVEDSSVIERGFVITTLALASLVAGVWLAGLRRPAFNNPRNSIPEVEHQPRALKGLGLTLFVIGLLAQFVLLPVLGNVATATSLIAALGGLSIVGACLGLHQAARRQSVRRIVFWFSAALSFPFLTLGYSGFLGFGAGAMITVLLFAYFQYSSLLRSSRTRRSFGLGQTFVVFAVTLVMGYLALSLFVTYFRDRTNIREAVWYEQAGLQERIDRMSSIVYDFEFFDMNQQAHINAVDGRLNQNIIVGQTADTIEQGMRPMLLGETFVFAVAALVPRVLWPGKPAVGGGGMLVEQYTGLVIADNTSVGTGQVTEFYINFGMAGVVTVFFLFGLALRAIDIQASRSLLRGDNGGFIVWFLPGLSFLQPGGELVEITVTFAASLVVAFVVANLLKFFDRSNQ